MRCKGAYVNQSTIWGKPARQQNAFHEETRALKEAYELKISALKRQLAERDALYERRFRDLEAALTAGAAPSQDYTSPSAVPTTHSGNNNTNLLTTTPHPPQPSTPIHAPHPSTAAVLYKLLTEPNGQVVAEGHLIMTSSALVHGRPLAPDHSRVSITVAHHSDALLPVPVGDEIVTVGQALNSMVAWPKSLILDPNQPVIA